jgi:hypothetical protein
VSKGVEVQVLSPPPNFMEELAKKLSEIYGCGVRLLGPYRCNDGRVRVDVCTPHERKTCQLARVKLEIKLKRKLEKGEEVDHIDEDKTNDDYDNLQLLTREGNISKSRRAGVEYETHHCKTCGTEVIRRTAYMRQRRGRYVFCSCSCSSTYWKANQYGNIEEGYKP